MPAIYGLSIAAVTSKKKAAMRASTWAVSATVGDTQAVVRIALQLSRQVHKDD